MHSDLRLRTVLVIGILCASATAWGQDRAAPPRDANSPQGGQVDAPPRADAPPTSPPPPSEQGERRGGRGPVVPEGVQLTRDVVYATVPGAEGKSIELKMDTAFLKQSDGKPMPAVVYIHGGGWAGGSREAGLQQSLGLAPGGYFAATIDYRLADVAKYPAAVHDCKAAIRFLRANAAELGIDPNRIGVWGHSAGGHLAALLGTSGNSDVLEGSVGTVKQGVNSAVQCVVDFSGPTDLSRDVDGGMIANWLGAAPSEKPDVAKQASPLTYIDKNDPPTLIIHGTEDELVRIRHAELLEKALKDAGATVEYLPVEGAGHMIRQPRVYIKAAEFFDQHLGGHAAPAIRERLEQSGDAQRGGQRPVGEDGQPRPRRRGGNRPPDAPPPPPPSESPPGEPPPPPPPGMEP